MAKSKQQLAAIDLGSNSFHLIVATLENNDLKIIDSVKEMVRLGAGLDELNNLSQDKISEAAECLKIFGQRIKGFSPRNVQCVGTNTLRKANNVFNFIQQAEQALGFSINIIGGREEARLVYQGVSRSIAQTEPHRLVIDIGGGSTEFIIGEVKKPLLTESLTMGCVNFTRQYFPKGKITKKLIKKAVLAGRQKIEWISDEYIEKGWQEVIGSSGTIKSVAAILDAKFNSHGVIYHKHLKKLIDVFIDIKNIDDIELVGLSNNRAPIIIGGVCVLLAAFEELDIDSMITSDGALREGLLYDIQNIADGLDIRVTAVKHMVDRYKLDTLQAKRIKKITTLFTHQLNLKDNTELLNLIEWSIDLHEVGLVISHVNTQQHSAYIVEQSDMAGFSRGLQNTIGLLLRLHRGKLKKKLVEERPKNVHGFMMVLFIIRLSIMLARGRNRVNLAKMKVIKKGKSIELIFPKNYLKNHPLTVADLEQEKHECEKIEIKLCFSDAEAMTLK